MSHKHRIYAIRQMLVATNFLQMKDDDFISVQNLADTKVAMTTGDKSFDSVEIF